MKIHLILSMISIFSLTSCSTIMSRNAGKEALSSSLVEFLYADKKVRTVERSKLPVLKLPVNVGLAFVPPANGRGSGIHSKDQLELLERVKDAFIKHDFINRIEIIPSTYLGRGNGFSLIEQVGRLYDVDVMALVSYDQVTQSFENNAALLYWTIAGMYVIPGNENSVQTFVDTAVFDIQTRKMLFRAPGINKLSQRSTAVGISATLSENSLQGFGLAVTDMAKNLDSELGRFQSRVKQEKVAKIEHREGYSGGGSLGIHFILLLIVFPILHRRRWDCLKTVNQAKDRLSLSGG